MREHRIDTAYRLNAASEEQTLQKAAKSAYWVAGLLLLFVLWLTMFTLKNLLPSSTTEWLGVFIGPSLLYFYGYLLSKMVRTHYQSLQSVKGSMFSQKLEEARTPGRV